MSRPTYIRGEILPPLPKDIEVAQPSSPRVTSKLTSNEDLNLIASWLDDRFEVPGIHVRFGLDAIIGWIPGIGDLLAALASMFIIVAGWKRGAARITLLRMMLNLTIENTLGAIPIVGDFAHVAWKANRRNYNLLVRDEQSPRQHTWQDWLFVMGACIVIGLVFLAPVALLFYLFTHRPRR